MGIKILIADDDALIRESLRIIFDMDGDFEVVECVENGLRAVESCKKNEINVALLDVRMPVMNGVQATGEISKSTQTKPLILTTFDDDEFIIDAVKNGAKGYLLKNNSPDKIKEAIKMVNSGHTVLQDVVLNKIKNGLSDQNRENKIDKELFTEREIEIIKLISQGLSNKEISEHLFISEGTVKNYITTILSKTGLQHRTQIAIYYLKGNF
ncbi:MAG TPA: response regulator transcription factor [Petrotogaceae bacterium]|jgi:DNA-binding NarL/FixJ family response regulator|nr:response regulator transcription factor [Petrotogaceae bacterium]HQO12219.1 response regulator transcription factor [Petrotogaceae bacterium]HQP57572.1 response regulator transcription factor [Petrotogaceae bacterium]